MKILYISPIYFEKSYEVKNIHILGGGGRYPFELAKNIQRLGKDDVEIIFFGNKKDSFILDGVCVTILPSIQIFPFLNGYANPLPLTFEFFKKIKEADIVHGIQIRTEAIMLATLLRKIIRKPMFVTDNGFGGISLAMLFPFESLATAVMAISIEDLRYWKTKHGYVIYAGVDTNKYTYKKEKKPYALYVGRFIPHKGIDVLVNGLPKEYNLIIAGNPIDKDYIKYLKNIAKNKKVKFLEKISDEQMIKLYQNASCFVLPSTDKDYKNKLVKKSELFGLVVAEAMACGTPVIVSDSGSLPEFINGNKVGFMFHDRDSKDLGSKITKLMENKGLRTRMGIAARELVEKKYNWHTIAAHVRGIYMRYYSPK